MAGGACTCTSMKSKYSYSFMMSKVFFFSSSILTNSQNKQHESSSAASAFSHLPGNTSSGPVRSRENSIREIHEAVPKALS